MSNETVGERGSREMPDFVKKGLVQVKDGSLYLKAAYRVLWMRHEHPDWAIITSDVHLDFVEGLAVFKATVMDENDRVVTTAHCHATRGRIPFLEKAETGAIARALGLCGYGTEYGELDEEDVREARQQAAETRRDAAPTTTGKCTSCNATKAAPGPHHHPDCPNHKK